VAGLRSYKPARRVRFPHLAPSSPIGGREPAFEAGDAGSIPARGTRHEERMVAVVYWSARLAVNEEVRVRSPPVTPIVGSAAQWWATGPENRGGG
jgi:hypothetical protein